MNASVVPRAWVLAALVVAVPLGVGACSGRSDPPAPRELRLATGWPDGPWNIVGQALAARYRQLPNLTVDAEPIADLYYKVDALQQGTLDLALVDSETAYRAYKRGTAADAEPHTKLRAIAVLFPTVVQILAREDAHIDTPAQLRGKNVDVGVKGGYAEQVLRLILQAYGLDDSTVHVLFDARTDSAQALRDHRIDALVYWTPLHHPAIVQVAEALPTRLVALDREAIGVLQSRNHFLKSTVVPAGSYPNQEHDVLTVGQDVLLLCRQDLPEDLVRHLTEALFDAVPELTRIHPAAGGIDVSRGPTASIPLHPGAAHYYRERELLK